MTRIRDLVVSALIVTTFVVPALAQETITAKEIVKRCAPKAVHCAPELEGPSIRVRKGEKPTGYSPVIFFEILETGEVAHAYLKRSSGISDVDQYALSEIRETQFNRRPGCGTIESQADVTVDLR